MSHTLPNSTPSSPTTKASSYPTAAFVHLFAETKVKSHLACLRDYIEHWCMENVPGAETGDEDGCEITTNYVFASTKEQPNSFGVELEANAICSAATLYFLEDGVEFVFFGPQVQDQDNLPALEEIGCLLANAYLEKFYAELSDRCACCVIN